MKIVSISLILFSFVQPASAEMLSFTASIQNEALSEESILLLHCLSDQSASNWQITTTPEGTHWLHLKEENGYAVGKYVTSDKTYPIKMPLGGAERTCQEIYNKPMLPIDDSIPLDTPPPLLKDRRPIWIATGLAVIVGGFFLWKSKQPDHSGIVMK